MSEEFSGRRPGTRARENRGGGSTESGLGDGTGKDG